jgi:mono/diheme cytochrome c family protein
VKRRFKVLIAIGLVCAIGLVVIMPAVSARNPVLERSASIVLTSEMTPQGLLTHDIPDATANASQVRRGQYLVAVGDCVSCHLGKGGQPLAGGLGLQTPFGVIYSSNITSDQETGIGSWTAEDFYKAIKSGVGAHGENLYPAFPYPSFRLITREDSDAILAFLKSTPAVKYTPPANGLHFPLSIRTSVKGWNLLYLNRDEFKPDSSQSNEWNRGAYLVNGLGHCGSCHTPKNSLGADETDRFLQGGAVEGWQAPDLTSNTQTGLGRWTQGQIVEYLQTGRNTHASAGAQMGEVITYSTSLMTSDDLGAIAVYLKSLPASNAVTIETAPAASLHRGAAIYLDACTGCHLENGVGQEHLFPPLGNNAMVQQANPIGLIHAILGGTHVGVTAKRTAPISMPSFAWKLSDAEIADVASYIRNSWGNQGSPVTADEVHDLRTRLDLNTIHYTANSGDQRQ